MAIVLITVGSVESTLGETWLRLRLRTVPVVVSALVAVVAGACGDDVSGTTTAPADQETATTAFTPDEGELVVYSGRNEAFVGPVVDAFTAATGIEVAVRYAGTSELATAILEEGDNSPADVFWAQDPAFIGGLANEGALTALPEEILTLVPDRFGTAAAPGSA